MQIRQNDLTILLDTIAMRATPETIASLAQVSRQFRFRLLNSPTLWKRLALTHIPHRIPQGFEGDWRALFIEAYKAEFADFSGMLAYPSRESLAPIKFKHKFYLAKTLTLAQLKREQTLPRKEQLRFEDMHPLTRTIDSRAMTPLDWVIVRKQYDLLAYFLSQALQPFRQYDGSLNVTQTDVYGLKVFDYLLCFHAPVEELEKLKKSGAELTSSRPIHNYNNVLFGAVRYGNLMAARWLSLEKGINLAEYNDLFVDGMKMAAQKGWVKRLMQLTHGTSKIDASEVSITSDKESDVTVFMNAISYGQIEMLREVLEPYGESFIESIEFLLCEDDSFELSAKRHKETFRFLIKWLADFKSNRPNNLPNHMGALYSVAIENGLDDLLPVFWNYGITVSGFDFSALHLACHHHQWVVAKILLENGATCQNKYHLNVSLLKAAMQGETEVCASLRERGAILDKDMQLALDIERGNLSGVEGYLRNNKSFPQVLLNHQAPFVTAVRLGHAEIFRFFIERGLASASQINDGLAIACKNNDVKMMTLLIEQGANAAAFNFSRLFDNKVHKDISAALNILINNGVNTPLALILKNKNYKRVKDISVLNQIFESKKVILSRHDSTEALEFCISLLIPPYSNSLFQPADTPKIQAARAILGLIHGSVDKLAFKIAREKMLVEFKAVLDDEPDWLLMLAAADGFWEYVAKLKAPSDLEPDTKRAKVDRVDDDDILPEEFMSGELKWDDDVLAPLFKF